MLNVGSISGRSKITPLYMASGAPLSSTLHAGWGYRKGSLASLLCTSGCECELGPEKALFLWQRLLKLWDTRPGAGPTWAPEKQGIAAVSVGRTVILELLTEDNNPLWKHPHQIYLPCTSYEVPTTTAERLGRILTMWPQHGYIHGCNHWPWPYL